MTAFIKKYIFVLISGFTILVFSVSLLFLNSEKDNSSFYIKSLYGDENLLKGLEVRGILQDDYSGVDFTIRDGKVKKEFMYYNDSQDHFKNMSFHRGPGDRMRTKDAEYYVSMDYSSQSGRESLIRAVKYTKQGIKYKQFESDITFSVTTPHMLTFGNRIQFMEELNGKLYFVIPTDETCGGKSGVYEISRFDNDQYYDIEPTGYRKLADIDLEDGKVQVRGMFNVQDNLVVVLTEGDKVVLKAFNLPGEEFSEPLEIAQALDKTGEGFHIAGGYSYNNYLMLCMSKDDGLVVQTFSVSGSISPVSSIDIDISRVDDIRDMIYKNGMLYVIVESYGFKRIGDQQVIPRDPEYYLDLFVYDNEGDIKFTGSVESDINQDNIWQSKRNKYTENRKQSYIHRRYEQIQLR